MYVITLMTGSPVRQPGFHGGSRGTSSGDDGRRSADDADEKSALKSFRAGAVVSDVWVEFILGKNRNFRREEGHQFLGKEKLLVVVPLF